MSGEQGTINHSTRRRIIILQMPDPDPFQTLTHELSHLAVREAVGDHAIPSWFMEGFAMFQAHQWGLDQSIDIAKAAMFGDPLSFERLETQFPAYHTSASLAYAQSFHFVRRLVSEYGTEAIRAWMVAISSGIEWKVAFEAIFGVPVEVEYEEWADSVQVWYAWIPALASTTTTWTGLAFLALYAAKKARRRKKLRLKLMELEESLLYPSNPDDELFG